MSRLTDDPRLRRVVLASAMALFAINVDFFSVQAAIPQMAVDVGTDVDSLQWVISGMMLALASFLIVAGRLGDIQGRRRWFLAGATTFGVASLLGGAASTSTLLIACRVLQGVGAAILFPLCLAVVTNAFPPAQTQRAVGLVFGIAAVGNAVGPFVGGALTDALSWRWVLWINVPVAIAVAALVVTSVEESRDESAPRAIDWPGVVLIAASLAVFTYGVDGADEKGWTAPITVGLIAAGTLGVAAFVVLEARVRHPLVDLALFRIREFSVMIAAGAIGNMANVTTIFLSMIYLQDVELLSPLAAGTTFLAFSLGAAASQQLSGRLGRFRSWLVMDVALLVGGIGGIAMGLATGRLAAFLAASVVAGAGYGMCWAYASVVTQSVVPPEKAGAASGIVLTVLIGMAGVAVAVASSAASTGSGTGTPSDAGAIGAVLAAFGLLAVAFVPVVTLLGRGAASNRPVSAQNDRPK